MSKPMIVVAKKEGFYGNQLHDRGSRFAIANELAFSASWMIDVETKDRREVEELRTLENERASRVSAKRRSISDEALLAEIAMADGTAMAAIRAENAKLKAKVAELTKQLEGANNAITELEQAGPAPAEEVDTGPETDGEADPQPPAGDADEDPQPASRRRRVAKE